MTITVSAADGRNLTVETWGAPHGEPVFLLHGTPGSRFGPRPRHSVLYRLGIRVIAYDRPGYGGSDRLGGRSVAHAAADVLAIADALRLETFAVVGRSGGSPHALACAALLSERVTRAAALVSLAPRDAEGLDWYAGMADTNAARYSLAESSRDWLEAKLEERAAVIRRDPSSQMPFLNPQLPESDRAVVSDFGIRSMLMQNFTEAIRQSGAGWLDDMLSFCLPWGFAVEAVRAPILLWHGAEDVFSPVAHSRWLADRIRDATLVVDRAAAHFGAVAVLRQVLTWVVSGLPLTSAGST